MILALALLAACGDAAVDAPETTASSERVLSTIDRLNALEAQTALLTKQLQAAQAKITTLQAENKAQATAIDAIASDNAIHTSSIGVMNNQINALAVSQGFGAAIASETLDYVLKSAGGPGRQGGHMTLVVDYSAKLAEAGVTPVTGAAVDELHDALFEVDASSGDTTPRVDGSAIATARRMRKRPELLYQEWDQTLSEYLVALQNNPIYSDSTSADFNPLFGLESRVDGLTHFVDDWQGETSALRATDDFLNGQVVYMKAIQATHTDYLLGLAGAKAPSPTPTAEELRLLMFDLGSPLVSDVAIQKAWAKNMDVKFPDIWSTKIKPEVSTLIADADKRREAGDLSVSAKASGEVKELADILKADYGKQIGDVQTDVDALWLDMLAGDEALQTQINELDAEVCALGEVVAGQWLGNDAMAAEAWLTLNGDGRFLACLAR